MNSQRNRRRLQPEPSRRQPHTKERADENSQIRHVASPAVQGRTPKVLQQIAKVYDLLAEKSEQPIREDALQLLAANPGEELLEIGFGTGHCVVTLARAIAPTGKVYGLDISEEMVAIAHDLLKKERLLDQVELRHGDAEDMPFESNSFDAIFTCFTLELFDNSEIPRVLAECQRVLKRGGRLVVAALSKDTKQGVVIKAFEWTHAHFPNLMDCRPIHVRQAIEDSGFTIERTQQEHMWVPVEIVLVLDSSGRLIGVNTAIYSPSGAYAGIGFAIPVDTVKWVVPELIKHGEVIRPGLALSLASDRVAERFDLPGVLILDVVPGKSGTGDHLVRVVITVPRQLSEEAKAVVRTHLADA